jgi:hypothetical protein
MAPEWEIMETQNSRRAWSPLQNRCHWRWILSSRKILALALPRRGGDATNGKIVLALLQSRHVLARLQPDMYFKMPTCQNVGDSEVGHQKWDPERTRRSGKSWIIGGGDRRWEHCLSLILAQRIFFRLTSREKVEFYVGCFTLLNSPYC